MLWNTVEAGLLAWDLWWLVTSSEVFEKGEADEEEGCSSRE